MTETPRLKLPLLAPSQAQKHVTVNRAFARLDALAQLVLVSTALTEPPVGPAEGAAYAVPQGATGAWAGRGGRIAVATGGGWDFVAPELGWRAFDAASGSEVRFDGAGWSAHGEGGGGALPAGFELRVIEVLHEVAAGAASATAPLIPGGSIVFGVTARVATKIGGASAFRLGVEGSDNRYASGIGTAAGSWLRGMTGSPIAYWSETPLLLTAEGGVFDGTGSLRLRVYALELGLPD